MKLRVMSFNIRNSLANDGINNWIYRKDSVQELLQKYAPDVIGFQETLPDQMNDLIQMLSEYEGIKAGRENGIDQGEGTPIFYRKTKFRLESQEKFWMGKNPSSPENSWSNLPRITLIAKLQVIDEPSKTIYIGNTHFDNVSEWIRAKSAKFLLSKIEPFLDSNPVIIMGDLNALPNLLAYNRMTTKLTDVFRVLPNQRKFKDITFHEFTGSLTKKLFHPIMQWIDYIFVNKKIQIGKAQIVTDVPHAPVFPSDHWPIICDLEL